MSGDADVVEAPATAETKVFGKVSETVEVPVDDGAVAWQPNLVFPGLGPDEQLDRRTRAPERAEILAADGAALAKGPSVARTSPVGPSAIDIAGEVGVPKGDQKEAVLAAGFPPGRSSAPAASSRPSTRVWPAPPEASSSPSTAAIASSPIRSPPPASR